MTAPSQTAPPKVALLVHGTWGGNSKWAKGEGELAAELAAISIPHETFTWSGRNSHAARLKASEDLAGSISRWEGEGHEVVVVAHSHGGNVARSAIARLASPGAPADAQPRRLVVCIATPFFWITNDRPLMASRTLIIAILYFLLSFFVAILPFITIGAPLPPPFVHWWATAMAGALALYLILRLVLMIYARKHGKAPLAELRELIDPESIPADVHIVATPSDEVALFFGAINFLSFATRSSIRIYAAVAAVLIAVFAVTSGSTAVQLPLALMAIVGLTALVVPLFLVEAVDRMLAGLDGGAVAAQKVTRKGFQYADVILSPFPRGTSTASSVLLPAGRTTSHTRLPLNDDARQHIVTLVNQW